MYTMIEQLKVGNFQSYTKIPDAYVRLLLGYIIQISSAMAHAHRNGLVHGNLKLSKVLVQRINLGKKTMMEMGYEGRISASKFLFYF